MNRNVMITCALTGAGDTVGRSEHVPVTPEQIAESGIAAARAGATTAPLTFGEGGVQVWKNARVASSTEVGSIR